MLERLARQAGARTGFRPLLSGARPQLVWTHLQLRADLRRRRAEGSSFGNQTNCFGFELGSGRASLTPSALKLLGFQDDAVRLT